MSSINPDLSSTLQKIENLFSDADIPSSRLDAELLLAHILEVDRSWLHAHGDETLQGGTLKTANELIARRLAREPIAYITGHKEFFGRDFIVAPDVLIPRPESETIIELLKALRANTLKSKPAKSPSVKEQIFLIDVGTGSGCLGITAKLELPELDVTLSDVSPAALVIARQNAERLGADIRLIESDLLSNFQFPISNLYFILANLPYVDQLWERSPETDHEPALALFADGHGLALIYKLLSQAPAVLAPGGYILLEADPEQHATIIAHAVQHGLHLESVRDYIIVLQR